VWILKNTFTNFNFLDSPCFLTLYDWSAINACHVYEFVVAVGWEPLALCSDLCIFGGWDEKRMESEAAAISISFLQLYSRGIHFPRSDILAFLRPSLFSLQVGLIALFNIFITFLRCSSIPQYSTINNLVGFSIFTELYNQHTINFRIFLFPQ